ncbi:MAG: hypothetical protein Pg6B_05680 [Candidatus Azobacteroides pseudotrichonymphae]|jgi:RimJ/RimL family protein N-acetyltransferase|uniref:Ribosomal-protein-serine acetyltransferase n=1 Tax=Azobacteroides pseudotrichonymphae genomovar. CFP2 TaxID=511995 RepID=B6YRE4_AZOPC|nr:GNAT family N-acetyltransferase [Candidatus Azobacteroides pseudotrichonymphae]MDR0530231.1 GNAT family N-acetyltransferase [Bacteroidales bacterium OttesenSCG-928-I14]BAG83766.1 putative ribosomal-protein-serine acetyltransferase [Candidatus Azobacteroides pseudotrichonymphae genomovar. CFP2]GMO35197.1 MAG: hypothetical protein Pg6B_05680 [Candidatus Azobacteroides pseudotrichonymphae]
MNNIKPQEKIESDRLFLSKYVNNKKTIKELLKFYRKDLEYVGLWRETIYKWDNENNIKCYIRSSADVWEKAKELRYAIRLKNNAFIGEIKTAIDCHNEVAEIGFLLDKDHAGYGYISEALLALESYLFSVGFYRIEIMCDTGNERSLKTILRTGHVFETVRLCNKLYDHKNGRFHTAYFYKLKNFNVKKIDPLQFDHKLHKKILLKINTILEKY